MFLTKRLVSLKLEGKIVLSLISGFWGLGDYPKRFTELKQILGVSDPGLSKALRGLQAESIVKRDNDGFYYVKPSLRTRLAKLLQSLYNDFLLERLQLVVDSLRQVAGVDSIIAFGSVAQGKASYDSDVDLLITVSKWKKPLEERIHDIISKWTVKMGIPIEAIVISTSAIVDLVKREYQLLFGLLQGYIPLYDKVGIATILHSKKEEIESKYEYHEDVSLWLPRTR